MMIQDSETCETIVFEIHMAGDINSAKRILSEEFYPPNKGFCVTITPQTFVYTAGIEEGFMIGVRNYPRFPSDYNTLCNRSINLASTLIAKLHQKTAMVVHDKVTVWLYEKLGE